MTKAKSNKQLDKAISSFEGVRVLGGNAGVKAPAFSVIPVFDWASGVMGAPWNRWIVIRGTEGGGKTTLLLHAAKKIQAIGGTVLFIDMEHKLDPYWVKSLGVNLDSLLVTQPPHMEAVFGLMDKAIEVSLGTGVPLFIILDSMNATPTKAEIDGSWEDKHWSPQSKVASDLCRKLTNECLKNLDGKARVSVAMVSQLRQGQRKTKKAVTAWGNAPRFYASQIFSLRKEGDYEKDGKWGGSEVVLENVKNQVAIPYRSVAFRVPKDGHLDTGENLLHAALAAEIVRRSGSWYAYKKTKLGQGQEKAGKFLGNSPDICDKILKAMREADEVSVCS